MLWSPTSYVRCCKDQRLTPKNADFSNKVNKPMEISIKPKHDMSKIKISVCNIYQIPDVNKNPLDEENIGKYW